VTRAVTHAERPSHALPIRDQLNLNMPGTGNKPLQEHNVAAERAQRLLPGALECPGEVVWRGDDLTFITGSGFSRV
jgi:hypothetical protein